jgi:hypothetical protein
MRQRPDALCLQLVRNGVELVPGLRWLQVVVLENLGVDPKPVRAMDVNRNGLPLAVMDGELLDLLRNIR